MSKKKKAWSGSISKQGHRAKRRSSIEVDPSFIETYCFTCTYNCHEVFLFWVLETLGVHHILTHPLGTNWHETHWWPTTRLNLPLSHADFLALAFSLCVPKDDMMGTMGTRELTGKNGLDIVSTFLFFCSQQSLKQITESFEIYSYIFHSFTLL